MSTPTTLRIGTRRSALATTQSGHVAAAITELTGVETVLVEITTDGDRSQAAGTPLTGAPSTGVFVSALRDALLAGEELLAAIGRLPTIYRVVLNLYCIEGYSHQEIGQQLGIDERTSSSQLSRARRLLAQQLRRAASANCHELTR